MSNYAKCFQNSSKSPNLTSIDIQEMNLAFYSINLVTYWDGYEMNVQKQLPRDVLKNSCFENIDSKHEKIIMKSFLKSNYRL